MFPLKRLLAVLAAFGQAQIFSPCSGQASELFLDHFIKGAVGKQPAQKEKELCMTGCRITSFGPVRLKGVFDDLSNGLGRSRGNWPLAGAAGGFQDGSRVSGQFAIRTVTGSGEKILFGDTTPFGRDPAACNFQVRFSQQASPGSLH